MAIYSLLFFLILVKLFDTQVIKSSYWQSVAKAQQMGFITNYSKRGEIFAKDNFPLALSVYSYELIINASIAPDSFDSNLQELFTIVYPKDIKIDFDKKRLDWNKALEQKNKKFEYLEKNLTHEQKNLINKLNLNYITLNPVPSRSYPDNESYSHLLGFVGKDINGNFKGYFGLEGYYDGDLKGMDGFTISERAAGGFPLLFKEFTDVKKKDGADLILTIDRTVQTIAFEEIKNAVKKYEATSGNAIILNPSTGEILALVNYPTFDPLKYGEYFSKDPDIFVNLAVSSTYEPGSVIKALTMSSAIDLGLVNKNTIIEDSGPAFYSGHKIDNWDGEHHGAISATQVLELSNNIGASYIGSLVGRQNLYNYFKKFGIASKTGIDLEGEEVGYMRNSTLWEDIDLVSASFGQSISLTPIQVLSAFGVIANNGVFVKPYIVSGVKRGDNIAYYDRNLAYKTQVIKKETANTLVEMLTNAASSGEAKYFMSKKYLIAGKTGTAQISEGGKYLKNATNATFVGFLPKYKEFVMLVKLEKPKVSIYASETAVPTWMNIAERIASYYGFSPDKNEY